MIVIGPSDVDALCQEAQQRQRKRTNRNIHPELGDPVQRLFNAMQPLSYVQPHRHLGEDTWEAFLLVQGEGVALTFDEFGTVRNRVELSERGIRFVEIPSQCFHTVLATRADTVFFEIKRGPYDPQKAKDFANWAPKEEEQKSDSYAMWLQNASIGQSFGG